MKENAVLSEGREYPILEGIQKNVLPNVVPTEIMEKFEVKTTFAWFYQPISFLFGLSYRTQLYIVLISLAICLIVYPLIRYLLAKL